MADQGKIKGRIWEMYRRANPTSERLAGLAREALPGGLTHDGRLLKPFPVYVERARGTRKWTADGQELVVDLESLTGAQELLRRERERILPSFPGGAAPSPPGEVAP